MKDSKNVRKIGLKSENLDKILELFYEYPNQKFTLREIEKKTKVPRATAQAYIQELKKRDLVTKDNTASNSRLFKTKKTNFYIEKIVSSGILEEIIGKLNPSCIILFGSIRKGESIAESDIDIFVESPVKNLISTTIFEKKLKHKVQLLVEEDIHKLQPNLFNNVVNGIKLYGSIKI